MKFWVLAGVLLALNCIESCYGQAHCVIYMHPYFGQACDLTDAVVMERNQNLNIQGNTNVRALTIGNGTQLNFIPANLLTLFPNIYYFNLDRSGLTELSPIRNCRSVAILNIRHTLIESIPAGIFEECTNMRILDLSNNQIREMHEDAFANLSQLYELMLFRNQITRIPSGIFRDLSELQDLYMEHNQISEIEDGAFANLPELLIFYLRNNRLTEFRAEIFGSEINLVTFSLAENLLTSIPRLPSIAPRIKYIALDRNQIAEINVGDFTFAYSNITDIELNENFLTRLDSAPFEVLERLDILSVNHNQIEAVDNEIFDRIPSLYSFYFTRNECADLSVNNVRVRLDEVNRILDHCFYEFVEPQIEIECNFVDRDDLGYTCELETLQYRDFNHKFRIIGEHLESNENSDVRAIVVDGGNVDRIPPTLFRTFENLESLTLNNVGLSEVNQFTFRECGRISHLNLAHNRIRRLPLTAFANCEFVEQLDLDNNQIAEIEPCNNFLTNVYLLQSISLRNNLCVDRFIENYRGGYFLYHTRELFDPYVNQCYAFWYLLDA